MEQLEVRALGRPKEQLEVQRVELPDDLSKLYDMSLDERIALLRHLRGERLAREQREQS
jgi:hypothetical protein